MEAGRPWDLMLLAKGRWLSLKAYPTQRGWGPGGCLRLRWSPAAWMGGVMALWNPDTFLCDLLPTKFVENVTRTDQASVTTMPTPTWLRRRARTRRTRSPPPLFPRGRRSRNVS